MSLSASERLACGSILFDLRGDPGFTSLTLCDFVLGNTPSLLFIPLGNHAPSRYSLEALRGKQERQAVILQT